MSAIAIGFESSRTVQRMRAIVGVAAERTNPSKLRGVRRRITSGLDQAEADRTRHRVRAGDATELAFGGAQMLVDDRL